MSEQVCSCRLLLLGRGRSCALSPPRLLLLPLLTACRGRCVLLLLAVVWLLLSRVRLVLGVGAAPARGLVGPSVLAATIGAGRTLRDNSAVAAGHDAGQCRCVCTEHACMAGCLCTQPAGYRCGGRVHLLVSAPVAVLLVVPRPAVVLLVAPSCRAVVLAGTSGRRTPLVHGARGGHRLARQVLVLRVVPAPVGRRPLLVVAVALG